MGIFTVLVPNSLLEIGSFVRGTAFMECPESASPDCDVRRFDDRCSTSNLAFYQCCEWLLASPLFAGLDRKAGKSWAKKYPRHPSAGKYSIVHAVRVDRFPVDPLASTVQRRFSCPDYQASLLDVVARLEAHRLQPPDPFSPYPPHWASSDRSTRTALAVDLMRRRRVIHDPWPSTRAYSARLWRRPQQRRGSSKYTNRSEFRVFIAGSRIAWID